VVRSAPGSAVRRRRPECRRAAGEPMAVLARRTDHARPVGLGRGRPLHAGGRRRRRRRPRSIPTWSRRVSSASWRSPSSPSR
jgi:hypothetical protein